MKNLNRLGLVFGVGTIAALSFSLAACGDDSGDGGSGGTGGSSAGASTGGAGASTGGAGASTGGAGASTGGAGASTGGAGSGGGGAGGKAGSGGGGAGGAGGGGSGGGGAGGAGGGGAGGGGAGGGGGAPSADCTKWCSGADSVLMICKDNSLPDKINTEQKCLDVCKVAPSASVTCWVTHTANAKNGDKGMHCPHATGAANQTPANTCPQLP